MELVAENGFVVSIPQGSKKELGRGSELAIYDKTVSRHQILLELLERSKEGSLAEHNTSFCRLSVKVLGANPVCIVHIGRQSKGRSDDQEMILLKKGETYTLSPGDKISLSLTLPMFFTVREGEGRNNIAGSKTMERPGSSAAVPMEEDILASVEGSKKLAEDDLLGKWKERKKKREAGPGITHGGTAPTDALETRGVSAEKDIACNEEEAGIAQAVARRQRRALERRRQQEKKLQDEVPGLVKEAEDVPNVYQGRVFESRQQQEQKLQDDVPEPVKKAEDVLNGQHEDKELEDGFVKTDNIDPVKEFGFLVEGSEFEQYKKHHKPRGRWLWPPAKPPAESVSDEDDENEQERHPQSRRRKARTEEDEEWMGEDQEEVAAVAGAKKHKARAKVNLRSHEPSSSKKRTRKTAGGGDMARDQSEETEDEEEDEADDTLGGFIVKDEEEEEPIDDDADDEDEATSDEEEMDDVEEDDEGEQQQNKERKINEEKPLCKYGRNCYRKNPDHLMQFRH